MTIHYSGELRNSDGTTSIHLTLDLGNGGEELETVIASKEGLHLGPNNDFFLPWDTLENLRTRANSKFQSLEDSDIPPEYRAQLDKHLF
jgi:hypothetical protein